MSLPTDQDYEKALAEATTLFRQVMDLRGFVVKDDADEFQARMSKAMMYSFATLSAGANPDADAIVRRIEDVIMMSENEPLLRPTVRWPGMTLFGVDAKVVITMTKDQAEDVIDQAYNVIVAVRTEQPEDVQQAVAELDETLFAMTGFDVAAASPAPGA